MILRAKSLLWIATHITWSFERIVLLFDGRDPQALAAARESWKRANAAGLAATYWKESAAGKWEKQG